MKKVLNLTELSKYIGINKRTLYRMIEDGRFPVDPIPKTSPRLWNTELVTKWLEAGV